MILHKHSVLLCYAIMCNVVTHFSFARARHLETLADRVRSIVDLYWEGSVNAAAAAMGIPQQTLQRVASGKTVNPRVSVLDAIAKGSRASVDWLLTGEGRAPQPKDERDRFISGGSARWFRLVESLYPQRGGVREVLDDVPFGPTHFVEILVADAGGNKRLGTARKWREGTLQRLQASCAEAWAELLEEAIAAFGADAVRNQLDANEIVVAGAFTPFMRFVSRKAMSKSEAKRYLQAWEDELTRDE